MGTVLINSDAAIFEASGCMGAGVVVRDHLLQHFARISLPELAEALALRRAVELARDEGLEKVIFESDGQSLVQQMNSTLMDRSLLGIVMSGIKLVS
jgi:ribonuclease HI